MASSSTTIVVSLTIPAKHLTFAIRFSDDSGIVSCFFLILQAAARIYTIKMHVKKPIFKPLTTDCVWKPIKVSTTNLNH
jgi:hypothetical protein